MKEKSNEVTGHRPQGGHIIDAPLVAIDLPSFNKIIRNEKAWKDSDRNAITIFKSSGMRIVLIALHKDAEMIKHTAAGMISIQVLEGEMSFKTDEHSIDLVGGQMLVLHEGISHSVLAKQETTFLLTFTTTFK
jgi:quercetin dioxygenase-like cupin family protein